MTIKKLRKGKPAKLPRVSRKIPGVSTSIPGVKKLLRKEDPDLTRAKKIYKRFKKRNKKG